MENKKIVGIVGTGKIGGSLAMLLVKSGYQVILASKNYRTSEMLVLELGFQASIDSPEKITEFCDIVILSVPLGQVPFLTLTFRNSCKDKILIDTCNPSRSRDGKSINTLKNLSNSSVWLKKYFPGTRIVKAFNTINDRVFAEHVGKDKAVDIAIPIASDYPCAMDKVSHLVKDIGFAPVIVGNLDRAKEFGPGTMPYGANVSKQKLQEYFDSIFNNDLQNKRKY